MWQRKAWNKNKDLSFLKSENSKEHRKNVYVAILSRNKVGNNYDWASDKTSMACTQKHNWKDKVGLGRWMP